MQFEKIIGQQVLKEQLIAMVNNATVSHAMLFLGKQGSGNLPLALAYAQYLNCENPTDHDSCGVCGSCVKYASLAHPDLHLVFPVNKTTSNKKDHPISDYFIEDFREFFKEEPYGTFQNWKSRLDVGNKQLRIGVAESQNVVRKLQLKAYEGKYKVVLIWCAETISEQAANKLLKILEEPPEKTLFFLVGENPEALLATILSRVQIVHVSQSTPEEIAVALIERHQLDPVKAQEISEKSDGNYHNAVHLLSQTETEELVDELFVSWMRICYKGAVVDAIKWVDGFSKENKETQRYFFQHGLHIFRESLIQNYGESSLQRLTESEKVFVSKFAKFIHGGNCIELIELFTSSSYAVERNANAKPLMLSGTYKVMKLLRVPFPE